MAGWGTVCDDGWDLRDGVACRGAGLGALAARAPSSGRVQGPSAG